MVKNYLKTAFGNLWKSKGFTALNITGLAIGLAICLLIMLFTKSELSYDRYNKKASRIYRINNEVRFGGNYFDLAVTGALMGPVAMKELPQIEQYCRLKGGGGILIKKGTRNLRETQVVFADSTLFDVFTLELIAGNPKTALVAPHSMVITESAAKKYFGAADALGQTLMVNDTTPYQVTAIMRDMPAESHFRYDIFLPMSQLDDSRTGRWFSENYNTYILVRPNVTMQKLNADLESLLVRNTAPEILSVTHQDMAAFGKKGGYIRNSLTKLTDIHLHSNRIAELQPNGSPEYVYIFTAVALFILVIACVNFMNLSTARSANRAKEVGVRKVLGSLRRELIGQFLTESLLMSFISLVFALLIAWTLLPYFNILAAKDMRFGMFFHSGMLAVMLVLVPLVGLLAGSYPAFYLSAFQPMDVLKGKVARGFKGSVFRNVLVVFQFAISIILIVGTIVIYNQLHFMRTKDIGFDRDQVLVIKGTDALKGQGDAFQNELKKLPGVRDLTATSYLPVEGFRSNDTYFTSPSMDVKTAISMQRWMVDDHYVPTLGLHIVEGRNFSEQLLTDSDAIIINEAAARFLGPAGALHKRLFEIKEVKPASTKAYEIIGIVKNFNFSSLRDVVTPLCLRYNQDNSSMAIRLSTRDYSGVVGRIKEKWESLASGQPFDYAFMDNQFDSLYRSEQRTGKLFISFAALAVFIASLGLFGLSAYAAEQRTREIGIRKVLGASVMSVARMLSKEFLKLVIVSAVIAFPIAWWAMHRWLQDFAYRVQIDWRIFAFAALLVLSIALLTVSLQAIKAAMADPVKSLRTE